MPDPFLLTPGPLTTSATVKQAMLHDWGSRDPAFIAMNRRVRERLVVLAGGGDTHVCVPVQGSGTFAVEAAIGTLVPPEGKLLVLVNGAYGRRMLQIARVLGYECASIETAEDTAVSPEAADRVLTDDRAITHVAVVQCETTSGLLNPIEEVAVVCARHGRSLLIDAMSAFGALPLDAGQTTFDALMAARYRRNMRVLLEGMGGFGFEPLLPPTLQAPIIVTFHMPADPRFVFEHFYEGLRRRGYVIYPGKLTVADSFRMGCIGRLDEAEMRGAVAAVGETLADMGARSGAPRQDKERVA